MSYIGRQLNNLSDRVKLDSITASATATYNLLLNTVAYVPSSAESLTVSLNGVIQAPQDSYTVSGSTITFASALTSSDSIDFILAERSITFQTPSSGSVGITELAVSDGTNGQALTTNGSGTLSFSTISADLSFGGDTFGEDKVIGSNDNYSLGIETNGSERIRFRNDGKIRIGGEYNNSTKGTVLISSGDSGASVHVGSDELVLESSGDAGMTILTATNGDATIRFGDSGNNQIGRVAYNHSSNYLNFWTNNSERMRIDSDGRPIFGSSAPIDTNANMSVYATNNYPLATKVGSTANTQQIGFNNGNGHVGGITTNGSATSYNTSSDYRLKENEVAISDGIERLKQLKPYKFNFKTDTDTTLDGFMAHEVSSIVPEAITGSKDATETKQNVVLNANGTMIYNGVSEQEHIEGKEKGSYPSDSTWIAEKEVPVYQSIDQAKLVPLLTSALQEAITKIETLEARVQALENA